MAAIKMPPRQRMINMLYLVLTAMLAMNVSKEVLDAFAVLDADLVRSERAHEQRSRLEYAVFDDEARKFPERFGALRDQAHAVREAADSLVEHIERMKTAVIAEAEDRPEQELLGRNADGRDSLLALRFVEAKDDRDVLTRMLIGSEPDKPRDGDGTAKDLKRRIAGFRDQLKALCQDRGPELAAALDLLFTLEGGLDASGTLNNWESINFYDVPLVAGIAHLSKLQADVRSAENDVVKWLYRSATEGLSVMSDVASAVIPRSPVVLLGDTFMADVFLAAYDRKNRPRIELSGGSDLPLGPVGKGKLRLRADRVGEHVATGVIHYQGPKGMEEHPYSVTYQVMAPMLVASPTKMNVLYRGVDNPISFSVPGVTPEHVHPTIDKGSIHGQGDERFVRVDQLGTAFISAMVDMPDGSRRSMGRVEFRVKDLPPPVAIVNGYKATDTKCLLSKLQRAEGLRAERAEACDFNEPYVITHFDLEAELRGNWTTESITGGTFTQQARKILNALRPGNRVEFKNIKARLVNGKGPEFTLPGIMLRVQ